MRNNARTVTLMIVGGIGVVSLLALLYFSSKRSPGNSASEQLRRDIPITVDAPNIPLSAAVIDNSVESEYESAEEIKETKEIGQDDVVDEAAMIVKTIFETPIGHMTRNEALELVEQFKNTPGAEAEIDRLMTSEDSVERLLGIFLELGVNGYSEDVLEYAINEHSPHVRAEVASWLFRTRDFENFDAYLDTIGTNLTEKDIEQMISGLSNTPPRMSVPVAMSLLKLGEGLESFFNELALWNDDVLLCAKKEFQNKTNDHNMQKRMLKALAYARPDNYNEILMSVVENPETPTITRHLTIQYLAAEMSSDDPDAKADLMFYVKPSPPDVSQIEINMHEDHIAKLHETEQKMHDSLTTEDPIKAGFIAHLHSYLDKIEILGTEASNNKVTEFVLDNIKEQEISVHPDYLLQLDYLHWRVENQISGKTLGGNYDEKD